MGKQKKVFSKEFKDDAVKLYRSGDRTLTDVASSLGIGHSCLSRWNREFDDKNAFTGHGNPRDKELYELKKRIKNLEEERDILKKAMAIFSQPK